MSGLSYSAGRVLLATAAAAGGELHDHARAVLDDAFLHPRE